MTRMPRALRLCVVLLLVTACGGGGEGEAASVDRPPSGLLISLDTTRFDALGVLGGPRAASPRLDALAAEGVTYTRARTVSPLTLPSHASMLTGLTPWRHTVHTNSQLAVPSSAVTLAERAQERGYRTGAFVAAVVLAADFGLDQGFETYSQPTPPLVQDTRHYDRRPGDEVADAAVDWIEGLDPAEPFFAWTHFFDPHLPYTEHPDLIGKVGDPYHAEVAAMDRAIGRILDALEEKGRLDDTLILVVADHGESQGEHGEATHGALAYDSTIRVPMILRYPDGYRAGARSDEIVSVVDVFPTLVEGLSLGAASDVDGISLFRRDVPADRGVYLESYYGFFSFSWSPVVGWADRDGKYLFSSDPEFYATPGDPGELRNLIAERSEADLAPYRAGIERIAAGSVLERGEGDATEAAVIDMLRGLGYTGSGSAELGLPSPLEATGLPSPASMGENYRRFLDGQGLVDAGKSEEAVRAYRAVVDTNPRNAAAWFQLGGALLLLGEYEDSLAASERALAEGSRWYGPLKNLGLAQFHLGRKAEALASFDEVLQTAPQMPEALSMCADLADELGRTAEATAYRLRLLEVREAEEAAGIPGR